MNKYIKSALIKISVVIIFLVFGSLIVNKNTNIKNFLYKNIYNSYLSLSKIKGIYTKYLGNISLLNNETKEVFNEKIRYNELSTYNNGIKLSLDNNYSIPIIRSGIVIFIGNKEGLNNTVIVEDENGIDYIYGNLSKINVKIYDYVKENDYLGEALDNTLYLVFQKGDKYLDYKEYLK